MATERTATSRYIMLDIKIAWAVVVVSHCYENLNMKALIAHHPLCNFTCYASFIGT